MILEYDNVKNKLHPTQKPIGLIKKLIENSSQKNEVVLDMFARMWNNSFGSKRIR